MSVEVGFSIKHDPPKDVTGVEPIVTKICADLSAMIYGEPKNNFSFERDGQEVEVQIYDSHGSLDEALPRFAAVVTGKTMILVWRGSTTKENWLTNLHYFPVVATQWAHVAKDLRVHSGFLGHVENDFSAHGHKLLEIVREKGINQLIMTGHSLGGGIAQVAQLWMEGSMSQEGNPWKQFQGVVKAITYGAPSSVMPTLPVDDVGAKAFLDKVASNSFNIVYRYDPIPHTPANIERFVYRLLDILVEDFEKQVSGNYLNGAADWLTWLFGFNEIPEDMAKEMLTKFKTNQSLKPMLSICKKFRHIGKIIHYLNDVEKPAILHDYGEVEGETDNFRNLKYHAKSGYCLNVMGEVLHDHSFLIRGPGLGKTQEIPLGTNSRLHWIHEKSCLDTWWSEIEPIRFYGWADCLKKVREQFNDPSMGAVIVWDSEPKENLPHQRGGSIWIKYKVHKFSKYADIKSEWGIGRNYDRTIIWRTGALEDLEKESKYIGHPNPHQWKQ